MAITKFYYDQTNFLNTILAINIAMENHYGSMFFPNEENPLDRIVYASNDYAFRKRTKDQMDLALLDLPFFNYYVDDINAQTDRPLWNNVLNVDGRYIPELNRKVRSVPVTIDYECTLFLNQPFDLHYATSKVLVDDSNETQLTGEIEIGDYVLQIPAWVSYDHSYNNEYNENDWLEQNKIFTLGLNVSLQTFLLLDDGTEDVAIAEDILFTFLSDKNLNKTDPLDSATANILIQEYFSNDQ